MPEDSALLLSVQAALTAAGWQFTRINDQDREVLRLDFDAHHTRVPITLQIFGPIGAVAVVAENSHQADERIREKLAELLMRTNIQLTIGNFELNWDTMRVFFRLTNLFTAAGEIERALPGMVSAAVAEMDRMTPQIAELLNATPEQLKTFDTGRLMRREDYLPDPENTAPIRLELK